MFICVNVVGIIEIKEKFIIHLYTQVIGMYLQYLIYYIDLIFRNFIYLFSYITVGI